MFEDGKRYNNFTYAGSRPATNVNGTAHFFKHRTNALVVYIETKTDKKCFNMSFRTPAKDDSGVTHIIEHSVLSGSKKYPAFESLFHLMNHSLADDLNAYTANDRTCYHFTSRNSKDFDILFDYYMDGIFNPSFLENIDIFLREGWHLENLEDGKVGASGVVFNEMKAHMLNKIAIEYGCAMADIFPNTCYQYEAGGDIVAILNLSYDKVCEYYKKYYHPSNSVLVLYGEMDIEKYLKILDEEFFAPYKKRNYTFRNYRTNKNQGSVSYYKKPVTMPEFLGEELHDVWLSFANYNGLSRLDRMITHLLLVYFLSFNEHKVRYKLLKGEWADEMEIYMDSNFAGDVFGVIFNNVKKEDTEAIAGEFIELITAARDEGLDYKNLKILIKLIERYYLNDVVDDEYVGEVSEALLRGEDPFAMSNKECIEFLYDKLENDLGFFSSKLDELFLECTTYAISVFEPYKNYKKRLEKELDKAINPKFQKWTEEEKGIIEGIVDRLAKDLYVSEAPTVAHQELTLDDIETNVKWNDYESYGVLGKLVNGYVIPDADDISLNFTFDISNLTVRETSIFSALSDNFFGAYTKKRTQAENSYQSAYLFEDQDSEIVFTNTADDKVKREFILRLKVKEENMKEALDLLGDILSHADFSHCVDTYSSIYWSMLDSFGLTADKPQVVAPMVTKSHFSKSDNLTNRTTGPEACKYLYNLLLESQDKKGMRELAIKAFKIYYKVFNVERMSILVASKDSKLNEKVCKQLEYSLKDMKKTLSKYDSQYVPVTYGYNKKSEAAGIQSLVQYNALSLDVREEMKDFKGSPDVICSYLQEWIIHKHIREFGNAYGSNVKYSDGVFTFTSYRDPEIANTLDVFANAGILLKNIQIIDFDKHKIAVAGAKNMFESEMDKIEAIEDYVRRGLTEADMKKDADKILETTEEDLKKVCGYLEKAAKEQKYSYYVIGNEEDIVKTRQGLLSRCVRY